MRLGALLVIFATTLAGQDLHEIVRRAVDLDARNTQLMRGYTYHERRETHEFDGSGKVRRDEVRTWDAIPLEGTTYRRLIARNDLPISAEERRTEDAKLQFHTELRLKETAAERQKRISEWEHRQQQRTHEPLKELPDAFDFTPAGEALIDGRTVYVIDAKPKPGYHPKSLLAGYFPKIRARLWIDKAEGQWVRVDAESLDTISFAGFVLRVAKGSHYIAEQMPVDNNIWVPRRIWYKASARIALVKVIQMEQDSRMSDYHLPHAEGGAAATVEPRLR